MASFLSFHSFVLHCNLTQLGVLIDPEDVPAGGAVIVLNKHGPNQFDDIWNMPLGKKLFLDLNKAGQLVGKNARSWARPHPTYQADEMGTLTDWEVVEGPQIRVEGDELSKDNKDRRGKQMELHTLGSITVAQTTDSIAKKKGRQLEKGEMYEVAYSHRDDTTVNATTEANIAKMKQLIATGSQLQGNNIEAGILWQPNNSFGQVISAKRGGHVRGVGFGPNHSGNRTSSMDDSTPPPTSTATNQKVMELSS
ncbi:hypothetical protein SO802_028196 [Lithocarpus litseifolius]|uniref:Uncharacterized protein n=1 Tax=Lithocarpus litseifolius TaxID=425828 RepID=A0AAW2BQ78_9ROSI